MANEKEQPQFVEVPIDLQLVNTKLNYLLGKLDEMSIQLKTLVDKKQ